MCWRAGLPRGRLCQRVAPERLRSALLGSWRVLCPLLLQDLCDCLLIGGLLLAQLLLTRLPNDSNHNVGGASNGQCSAEATEGNVCNAGQVQHRCLNPQPSTPNRRLAGHLITMVPVICGKEACWHSSGSQRRMGSNITTREVRQQGSAATHCLNEVLLFRQVVLPHSIQHGRIGPFQLARGVARLGVRALPQQALRRRQPVLVAGQATSLPQRLHCLIWLP